MSFKFFYDTLTITLLIIIYESTMQKKKLKQITCQYPIRMKYLIFYFSYYFLKLIILLSQIVV
jgi:hypothetical protein